MKRNVGSIDGMVRIVVGFALVTLVLVLDGDVRWVGFVGLFPLTTGFLRECPVYTVLGFSTCAPEPAHIHWPDVSL